MPVGMGPVPVAIGGMATVYVAMVVFGIEAFGTVYVAMEGVVIV